LFNEPFPARHNAGRHCWPGFARSHCWVDCKATGGWRQTLRVRSAINVSVVPDARPTLGSGSSPSVFNAG
jgi:hypothetical protein